MLTFAATLAPMCYAYVRWLRVRSFLKSYWEASTTAATELPSPNQLSARPLYVCCTSTWFPALQSLRAPWKQ
jgi:hypothetical protein